MTAFDEQLYKLIYFLNRSGGSGGDRGKECWWW